MPGRVTSALVDQARSALIAAGVRIWFGNTGTGLDADRLTNFYQRHGFNVIPSPGRLPPFFGTDWDPTALDVDIWFWTRLTA